MDRAQLVGRDAVLAALDAHLDAAVAGRGRVAIVEADAGLGKSAVVNAVSERAAARGCTVFASGADEFERAVSFAPLVDALGCRVTSADPERAAIATSLRRPVSLAPNPLEPVGGLIAPLVESFCGLLEAAAIAGPTVLVIEDLHWADRPTVTALRSIARRLADHSFLLLLSTRPGDDPAVGALLDRFQRDDALRIVLTPLQDDEVAVLAARLLGAEPGPRLTAKLAGAGGNPLFLTELLHALEADGLIERADAIAEIDDDSMPPSLRHTILRMLGSLPAEDLDLLRSAALLGTVFDPADLAAIVRVSMRELDGMMLNALRTGVIVPSRDKLMFRHDLVREAIYFDIPEAVRRGLHREAADLLEAAGVDPVRVAGHLVRGAEVGDRSAIDRVEVVFQQLVRKDRLAALELFQASERLFAPDDPDRDLFVAAEMEQLLRETGDFARVDRILAERLARPHPPRAHAFLHSIRAALLATSGDRDGAFRESDRALAVEGVPPYIRLEILAAASSLSLTMGRLDRSRDLVETLIAEAKATGDPWAVGLGLLTRAYLLFFDGRLSEALAMSERAAGSLERATATGEVGRLERSFFMVECDRFDEARALVAACFADGEGQGTLAAASLRLQTGDWDDADVELEDLIGAEADTPLGVLAPWGSATAAAMAVSRGRMDQADELLRRAEAALAVRGFPQGSDLVVATRARWLDARGQTDEALALIRSNWDGCSVFRSPTVFRFFAPDAIRIARAVGGRDAAQRFLDDALAWAARTGGVASAEAMALRCRGLFEDDPGPLLKALAIYEGIEPRVYERALCGFDAAAALTHAGRATEARPIFDRTIDAFERMGADHLASAAHATMRAAGMRRGARGKRGRPTAGWESLTPTELKVIEHVAKGMRNAEVAQLLFISPATVSTHLRHVYGKLGIGSRVELTRAFAARDP